MKTTNSFYALTLIFIFALTGCGDWNQNPLKNARTKMGEGQQKPTNPDIPDTLNSDFVKIDAPFFQALKEGERSEIEISGRVLEPDYDLHIAVENLSDFPGATFDSVSGRFDWTPPMGTITEGDIKDFMLEVRALATKKGKPVLRRSHKMQISVIKVPHVPTVTQITSYYTSVREESSVTVRVTVEDKDGGTTADKYPILMISDAKGYPSLAPFVTVSSASVSNKIYTFDLKIDLYDKELTKNFEKFGFAVTPMTQYGKIGAKKEFLINVATSLNNAVSTWADKLTVNANEKVDFQFLIMDPKSENKLETPMFTGLPAGAKMTCQSVNDSVLACRFAWTAPGTASSGTISASLGVKNTNYQDTGYKTSYLSFNYSVTTLLNEGVR